MRHDVGMGDDSFQVGLVLVDRDVLMVCGQSDRRIVGSKQYELCKVSHLKICQTRLSDGAHEILKLRAAWH